jgi:hypothetical protein
MFDEHIFAILQSVKDQEEREHRHPQPTPVVTPQATPSRTISQPAMYNRYNQESFMQQKEGKTF